MFGHVQGCLIPILECYFTTNNSKRNAVAITFRILMRFEVVLEACWSLWDEPEKACESSGLRLEVSDTNVGVLFFYEQFKT